MSYKMLREEAKRIRNLARVHFHAGQHLKAIFKNARNKIVIYYFNPKDIPETVFKKGELYYLHSVQKA